MMSGIRKATARPTAAQSDVSNLANMRRSRLIEGMVWPPAAGSIRGVCVHDAMKKTDTTSAKMAHWRIKGMSRSAPNSHFLGASSHHHFNARTYSQNSAYNFRTILQEVDCNSGFPPSARCFATAEPPFLATCPVNLLMYETNWLNLAESEVLHPRYEQNTEI